MSISALLACLAILVPPDEGELTLLSTRRAMQFGSMAVKSVESSVPAGALEPVTTRILEGRLAFDGDQLFTEIVAGRPGAGSGFEPFSIERRLQDSGRRYEHFPDVHDDQRLIAVTFAEPDHVEMWRKGARQLVDPRVLGLQPVPFALVWSCGIDEFIGSSSRTDLSAETVVEEGRPLRVIRFRWNGHDCSAWLSPEQGFEVVRTEIREQSGVQYRQDCVPALVGDKWFPKQIVFRQFNADGRETARVETTLTEVSIDESARRPNVGLAMLKLPAGTVVQNSATPGRPVGRWDGEKIAPWTRPKKATVLAPPAANNLVGWVVIGNIAFFGGLLMLIYTRRRS